MGADVGAREVSAARLAARAREAAGGRAHASADIDSFPFLGRLLATGSIGHVAVRVEGARAGPVDLAAVVVEAEGVVLDRSALASGRVRVRGIDRGLLAVELDAGSLTRALRVPVSVADGEVAVTVRGVRVAAGVDVGARGALVLSVAGLPDLTVPIVRTDLVPCTLTTAGVEGDRVRLTCQVDELPVVLRG